MAQHRKSKKRKPPKDMTIYPGDVKIRKRHAPGVRVIKSAKDKECKHKEDYMQEDDDNE